MLEVEGDVGRVIDTEADGHHDGCHRDRVQGHGGEREEADDSETDRGDGQGGTDDPDQTGDEEEADDDHGDKGKHGGQGRLASQTEYPLEDTRILRPHRHVVLLPSLGHLSPPEE